MDRESRIKFAPGPAGWAKIEASGATVYARFRLNDDKKTWRLDELRLYEPSTDALRSLPLGRIQSAARAAIPTIGLAMGLNQKEPADLRTWFAHAEARGQAQSDAGRLILERPSGRRLDDAFFATVAEAYRQAAAKGLNPRQTLAQDSGAAADTVARWIAKARQRGFLAPGQPGKVTT
jgi:hypothetical protein